MQTNIDKFISWIYQLNIREREKKMNRPTAKDDKHKNSSLCIAFYQIVSFGCAVFNRIEIKIELTLKNHETQDEKTEISKSNIGFHFCF